MWKVAQVEEGSTVAIFGLGAVGLGVNFSIPSFIEQTHYAHISVHVHV